MIKHIKHRIKIVEWANWCLGVVWIGSTLYIKNKKKMINPFTGINEEIDIHQRRSRLTDPADP